MFSNTIHYVMRPYWKHIYNHPFNQALYEGSLSIHCFYDFLEQDKLYLRQFAKSLQCVSERTTNNHHRHILMQLSTDAFNTQQKLHDKYLLMTNHLKFFPSAKQSSIRTNVAVTNYIHYIYHTAQNEPIPVAIASLLPCFYIYSSIGFHMNQKGVTSQNPYQLWISSYSNQTFLTSTQLMFNILNELAITETDTFCLKSIKQAFVKSVNFEIAFWDSIYNRAAYNPMFKKLLTNCNGIIINRDSGVPNVVVFPNQSLETNNNFHSNSLLTST